MHHCTHSNVQCIKISPEDIMWKTWSYSWGVQSVKVLACGQQALSCCPIRNSVDYHRQHFEKSGKLYWPVFLSVVALRHHYHHEFFWHVQNSTVTRGRRTHIYLVFFICQECTILFHSQDKLEKENHMIFSILRRKRSVKAIILVSQFGKHKETKSSSNYRAHLLLFCQIVRLVMEIWVMMWEARQPGSESKYVANRLKRGLPFKGCGSLNVALTASGV